MKSRAIVAMSVRRRLLFLAGLVVAAFAISAAASYALLVEVQIGGGAYDVLREKTARMNRLRELESALQNVRLHVAAMVSDEARALDDDRREAFEAEKGRVVREFERALGGSVEFDERVGIEAARRTWWAFAKTVEAEIIPALEGRDARRANALLSGVQARRAARFVEQVSTSLDVLELRVADAERRAVEQAGKTWRYAFSSWSVLAVMLLLATLLVARSITRPLVELTQAARGIASGERPERVAGAGDGEVGALSAAFNEMLGLLGETWERANRSDALLATAVASLEKESVGVRASSRAQNGRLFEMVTALKQIASGAENVRHSTARMSRVAGEAAQASVAGGETVRIATEEFGHLSQAVIHVADRVRELALHTREVAGFADVIASLARETHLLALNAGLEAVRAGEQGKGFALVASRVRDLALQAGRRAADVREVVERTEAAVTAVGEATHGASDAAHRGARAAGELTSSFDAIHTRIVELAQSVTTVEDVVREQTASVERSTALASESERGIDDNIEALQRMKAEMAHLREVADDLRTLLERLGGSARAGQSDAA